MNELRSLPRTIITAAAAAAGSQPQQVTLLTTSTSNNSSGTGNNNNDSSQATSTIITIKQESLANLQFVDSTTFLTSNAPHSPSSQMVNPNLVQCSTSSATTTTSPGELNSFSFYKKKQKYINIKKRMPYKSWFNKSKISFIFCFYDLLFVKFLFCLSLFVSIYLNGDYLLKLFLGIKIFSLWYNSISLILYFFFSLSLSISPFFFSLSLFYSLLIPLRK